MHASVHTHMCVCSVFVLACMHTHIRTHVCVYSVHTCMHGVVAFRPKDCHGCGSQYAHASRRLCHIRGIQAYTRMCVCIVYIKACMHTMCVYSIHKSMHACIHTQIPVCMYIHQIRTHVTHTHQNTGEKYKYQKII